MNRKLIAGLAVALGVAACGGDALTHDVSGDVDTHANNSPNSNGNTDDPNSEPDKPVEIPKPKIGALATGITIREIAIYQAVKISLVQDGALVMERNAPVVAHRPAAVRVFFKLDSNWKSRPVVARLELLSTEYESAPIEARLTPTGPSNEAATASSFNFIVDADKLTSDVTFSVSINETSPEVSFEGPTDGARFPKEGQSNLRTQDVGGPLKVVLVPVRYTAAGSQLLPDTSDAQVKRIRDGIMAMYPASSVEVTIRAPLDWPTTISASGQGWGELLQSVLSLRKRDRVETNVYYYGLFTPTESFARFCGRGCVAGLSSLSGDPRDDFVRGSIGLGYTGDMTVGTFVHEIGHAHGREHAPCGLGGQTSDRRYPYADADIGVWGYNIVTSEMIPQGRFKDMMSYCDPRWISDYQYSALFDRMSTVNNLRTLSSASEEWRTVLIDEKAKWGDTVELTIPPAGERREIPLVDAYGRIVGKTTGHYFPYSHIPGGILMIPERDADAADGIELDGANVLRFSDR